MSPRNILLITTDQERYFADDPAPLPARARLRELGTTFDRFYGASVACSSARSVMYTGHHVPITRVIDNVDLPAQVDLGPDLATIGTLLRDRGYYTAYKGKWHLSLGARRTPDRPVCEDALEPYGFSDYNLAGDDVGGPYEGFEVDDLIAADALHWLKSTGTRLSAESTPWFLAVNFVNPHDIMFGTTDREFMEGNGLARLGLRSYKGPPASSRYREVWDLPLAASCADPLDHSARPAAHAEFALAMSSLIGRGAETANELRAFQNYYVNCVRDVDAATETLLDGMSRLGVLDDTAIVFSSDHGELAGVHGLFGKGPCSYDENLRLPLVVVDPGTPGGRRADVMASQVDLVPTMLGLAGVPADAAERRTLPGRDLTGVVRADGDAGPARERALFAYDGLTFLDGAWTQGMFAAVAGGGSSPLPARDFSKRGLMRTVITDRYKFSRYFAPGEHHQPRSFEELTARNTLELFDLEVDPEERVNLAAELPPERRELVEELNSQLQSIIEQEIGEDDGSALPTIPGAPWA